VNKELGPAVEADAGTAKKTKGKRKGE